MTTFISDDIISEAVEQIINARELCGSEKEAVIDVANDHGITDKALRNKIWGIAKFRANAQWNKFKRQAGVNERYIL